MSGLNKRVHILWHTENDVDVLDTFFEKYAETFQEVAESALRGCTDDIIEIEVYEVPSSLDNVESYDLDLSQLEYRSSSVREGVK